MQPILRENTRLIILATAHPPAQRNALKSALLELRPRLVSRFGAATDIVLGVRHLEDPMAQIGADRHIESADAVLQMTFLSKPRAEELLDRVSGLGRELEDLFDLGKSIMVCGKNLVLTEQKGDVLFAFVSRRRPGMSLEDMRRHWLENHAPLAISVIHKAVPHGYDQIHVEPADSEAACAAAGIPFVRYDMADSVKIADLAHFVKVVGDPEMQRPLYEDEKIFLDHGSWRGLFAEVI